jgi:hypothetical protein
MAERSFRIRLSDIRGEIAGIRELTNAATAESFASSWAMTRAVQHALLIIAEAAKHIPPERKAEFPAVPWQTASATCCAMNIGGSILLFFGQLLRTTWTRWIKRRLTCSINLKTSPVRFARPPRPPANPTALPSPDRPNYPYK